MQIDIKASDIELTDPLREYIATKIGSLERYLKRFNPETLRVQVEVARSTQHHRHGNVFYAEANLDLPGKLLRATQTDVDIRAAIDKVRDILQREIRKYKDQHS